MQNYVYEKLASALNKLPNGFPRTPSNVEIEVLKKIFLEEEASIASQLNISMESVEAIAKRVGLPIKETETQLLKMSKKGLLWSNKKENKLYFRLAPFIVGIYESQRETMNHELAHLIEDYFADGGAVGIMKPQPALHRVVPAQKALKSEWILPYDDVRAILLKSKTFRLVDCICRVQQNYVARRCDFPLRTCLTFSTSERQPSENDISKEEALDFLDKAEEIGLVHTVSNVMNGLGYICNCCGCCCGILRGINDWGIENSVADANYYAEIEANKCSGCGKCRNRCQVHAISEKGGVSVVNHKKCIGCGLCVTVCPSGAARLERKSESEIVNPPVNFEAWEHKRLLYRAENM
ncbi:MAG TPA: 4Fe-4S binding protein [Candidatus Limnocylindrales bacterium]|nr:4Fe-4S binding protein [Candidatus Limnocylindrales bacterium]